MNIFYHNLSETARFLLDLLRLEMETSVHFEHSNTQQGRSNDAQSVGGVYSLRGRSSRGRKSSTDAIKTHELEDAEDEDAGLRDERDYKRKQVTLRCILLGSQVDIL